MSMYEYNDIFYRYIETGSIRSAKAVVPLVLELLQPASILDVGCGRGAWLGVWSQKGVDVSGIDGDYVDQDNLRFDRAKFHPHDLSKPFDLGQQFSLVECLEVAEHIPADNAATLIESLCKHADVVLFSAAQPGQGGENHINEQPCEYWREKFLGNGFVACDPFRPAILGNGNIEPWYRYNLLLFVRATIAETTYPQLAQYRVPTDRTIPDLSPPIYQWRKRLLSLLPVPARTLLAKAKKHAVVAKLKLQQE